MWGIVRGGRNEGDYNIGDTIHYAKLGYTKVPVFSSTFANYERLYDFSKSYYITFSNGVLSRYLVSDNSIINSFSISTPSGYNAPACQRPRNNGGIDFINNDDIFVFFRHSSDVHRFYIKRFTSQGSLISEGSIVASYAVYSIPSVSNNGAVLGIITSGAGTSQRLRTYNSESYAVFATTDVANSTNSSIGMMKLNSTGTNMIIHNMSHQYLYSIPANTGNAVFVSSVGVNEVATIGGHCNDDFIITTSYLQSGSIIRINDSSQVWKIISLQGSFITSGKIYKNTAGIITSLDINTGGVLYTLGTLDVNFSEDYLIKYIDYYESDIVVGSKLFKFKLTIQE